MGMTRGDQNTADSVLQEITAAIKKSKGTAVLSIQTIEGLKAALKPNEIPSFIDDMEKKNVKFDTTGDGHTGLAMAVALNAPFAVARTDKKDQKNVGEALKLKSGGLLVLTGHGSSGGKNIGGNYITNDKDTSGKTINRSPEEIVSNAMATGLKEGDSINILLAICYGADPSRAGAHDSFAEKLAKAFAEKGISTNIMASTEPVKRFGTKAIKNGQIDFNEEQGMHADDMRLFSTTAKKPTTNPTTMVTTPNKALRLSREGLSFETEKPNYDALLSKAYQMLSSLDIHNSHYTKDTKLNRQGAEEKLKNNANLNIIIHPSSVDGYITISSKAENGIIDHKLINIDELNKLAVENVAELKLYAKDLGKNPQKLDTSLASYARNKTPIKNQNTRIYCAFSGGLSKVEGRIIEQRIKDKFKDKPKDYDIPLSERQAFYRDEANKDLRIPPEAVAFLKAALQTEKNELVIVGGLPKWYIQDQLREAGISQDNIDKIEVIGRYEPPLSKRPFESQQAFEDRSKQYKKEEKQGMVLQDQYNRPTGGPIYYIGKELAGPTAKPENTFDPKTQNFSLAEVQTKIGIRPLSASIPRPPMAMPMPQPTPSPSDRSILAEAPDPSPQKPITLDRGPNNFAAEPFNNITRQLATMEWEIPSRQTPGPIVATKKGADEQSGFVIKPASYETNSTRLETFIVMLKTFKAANPGKIPEIKAGNADTAKTWKKAMTNVYPSVGAPNITIVSTKPQPAPEPPRPNTMRK